ncbi:SLC13 family permease [Bifidobacterium catulorum]|uniref:Citrate transporter n=1 Tax=Bifidobacterium catulorum TaxID=1630173 RepID=A0A2U2MTZ7_9BIFI|nr:SLC13 family permease [Bifidobacterium catulorum]PWG60305.1 citrate transporter [Bifidobacterium catulorum]
MNIYLAILGFATMIVITVVLLKKKMSILLAFTMIPLVAGLIALFINTGSLAGVGTIGEWVEKGIGKTSDITLMMMFSLPYFMLMADTGLFDDIVKAIMKRVKISAPVICILTVIVACIVELDGSITSVFLITVPLMLPLYEKFDIDRRVLPFLISVAILIMCNTPWNPKILRAATLTDTPGASTNLFIKLVPIQAFMIVVLIAVAVYFGLRARRKHQGEVAVSNEELLAQFKDTELTRHNMFWVNLLLTAFLIFTLIVFQTIPQYYVFAFGLVTALALNFRDLGQQTKLLKKYAASLFPVAPAVLLSGVVVGVMQESGMLEAMVQAMMAVVPSQIGPYVYIIIALFSTPLMLLFTNDTWFYALMPLVISFSAKYGVPAEVVIATLFMNFGSMISVIAQPQLYIATDLAGITIDQHIKFSWLKLWAINVVVVAFGVVTGVFLP